MLLQHVLSADPPEANKPSTRQRLVVAAAILFQRRGYYGVGTADILKLAEAPRGSLYHHFPGGKIDLACASVEWVEKEAVAAVRYLRLAGYSPQKVLKLTSDGIAAWMKEADYAEGSLLAALASCLDSGTDDQLQVSVKAAYDAIAAEYEQMLLVYGLKKRDAQSIANAFVADLEGASILARATRNTRPLKDAARRLNTMISQHGDDDGAP